MKTRREYTREEFEHKLLYKQHKNVILLRNGSFIGLYRYDKKRHLLKLWKSISRKCYGFDTEFKVRETGAFWGSGGANGPSAIIFCNEAHFIPSGYNLNNDEDLRYLDRCLGGCSQQVRERLWKPFIKRVW